MADLKRFHTRGRSQASLGAFALTLDDLAEESGCLLGAAPVDGQPVASMTVVVDHLDDSLVLEHTRPQIFFDFTHM